MPLQLSDDDEPTWVSSNTEQQQPGASTSLLDNEQELLELGDVPVLPTSSNEIDNSRNYLSEKGGLFDSDSDDELDLLSHHHYNNNNNSGKNSMLGIENRKITIGIVVLGLIFVVGFSLLLSYRMIEKPIERQSPKYMGLSFLWSPTVCKDSKEVEACKTISERVKTDKNNFIISSFQPTTQASSCEDPNQASYLGEKLPETTSTTYQELVKSYGPYWPPSLTSPGWAEYDKYGRCLYVNDTAVKTPKEYFRKATELWQYWTNIYYGHFKLTNETEIPYAAISFNNFAVPKCKSVGEKQFLLGLDICILGDNLQPATESTLCAFTTNCDTKKNILIA